MTQFLKKTKISRKNTKLETFISKMSQDKPPFDISKNILVPKHIKIKESEHKPLLDKYNISLRQLPRILLSDPAIQSLEPKIGDIIKIERNSPTQEKTIIFRRIVNG